MLYQYRATVSDAPIDIIASYLSSWAFVYFVRVRVIYNYCKFLGSTP